MITVSHIGVLLYHHWIERLDEIYGLRNDDKLMNEQVLLNLTR